MTGDAPKAPSIYLIACVSKKLDWRAPPADLYRSDWFRRARTYVGETGARWYVLSAEHGLVEPTKRLAPYDATLRDLTAAERRLWGENGSPATPGDRAAVHRPDRVPGRSPLP